MFNNAFFKSILNVVLLKRVRKNIELDKRFPGVTMVLFNLFKINIVC